MYVDLGIQGVFRVHVQVITARLRPAIMAIPRGFRVTLSYVGRIDVTFGDKS